MLQLIITHVEGRTLSFQYIVNVPKVVSMVPVLLPTLYLWLVDSLALSNGTWRVEPGTKYDIQLGGVLDIEYG